MGYQITNQGLLVMMMFMIGVTMTIRTGWYAPLSASWFTWVSTTGLAQNYSSPEVAR